MPLLPELDLPMLGALGLLTLPGFVVKLPAPPPVLELPPPRRPLEPAPTPGLCAE
jgi:hypothetical protein